MTYHPGQPIIQRQAEHQPELPILEISKRRVIQDFETEHVTFTARAKSLQDAKDGILFLIQCEEELKERSRGENK